MITFIGSLAAWFVVGVFFFANLAIPSLRTRQLFSFPSGIVLAKNKYKIENFLTKTNSIIILLGRIICVLFMAITQLNAVKNLSYVVLNAMVLRTCFFIVVGILVLEKLSSMFYESKILRITGIVLDEIYLIHTFTLNIFKPELLSILRFGSIILGIAGIL